MAIVMTKDGKIRPMQASDLKEVADRDERIRQLERLNATLAAEIDKQRAEHNAEVDEFNAGFEAAQQGLPESSEPSDTKYCPFDLRGPSPTHWMPLPTALRHHVSPESELVKDEY